MYTVSEGGQGCATHKSYFPLPRDRRVKYAAGEAATRPLGTFSIYNQKQLKVLKGKEHKHTHWRV